MRYLILLLILLCVGCSSVPKVGGLDFHIGSHEHGLWYDSDDKNYQPDGFGIKFSILWGKLVTPVDKWGENAWQGDKPAFVLRSPFFVFPYFSMSLGKYGFYLGAKPYEVYRPKHTSEDRYGLWWKDEVGTANNPAEFLCLTGSMRRTRWR